MWARWLLLFGVVLGGVSLVSQAVGVPRPDRPLRQVTLSTQSSDVVARVDAAFAERWSAAGIQPAEPADELAITRRLALGLMGTVPSLEEIRLIEAQPAGQRVRWWLGVLLADRRTADYGAERLARATVGTEDGPFLLFRRRRYVAWLSDQLIANRPYDEIVRHMIADAGLWTDTPATNFISVAIKADTDEDPNPQRLAARVARAFLGIRLDCAECHNHPFDRWKQTDFQSLAAFFGQVRRTGTGIRDRDGEFEAEDHKTGERRVVAPAAPYQPEQLPEQGTRRERLAAWVTSPVNKPFAREAVNRVWALLFSRGLVTPIDGLPLEDCPHPALDLLATDFVENGYDLRRLIETIVATRAFQIDSRGSDDSQSANTETEATWASFPLTRLRPEQMAGALLQATTLQTISYESHIFTRTLRILRQAGFIERYGDLGADEFDDHGGTLPQRLLMMNGELVHEKTKQFFTNAATQIAAFAPSDDRAVETAMLAVLTRRPTPEEATHFAQKLSGKTGNERNQTMEDIYWTLLNSTEFTWNH